MKIKTIFFYIFLFLLTALVLDLANPLFDKPSRDGGFFLYAGSQILDGKIPYQDFWDSKGPAIFYINALGLLFGSGSRWGVWFVEFIFIFGTFLILYHTLSKRWGIVASLFGITIAGLGLKNVLGYGNYTEEYALLFNAIGLLLFFSISDSEKNFWKYFWIGALFGLSFTFRANNIGGLFAIWLAVFLFYTFKKNFTEAMKIIFVTLAGFTLPLLLWILYFALHRAAGDMIYASLIFNFSYSAAKDRTWLDVFGGFGRYGMGWVSWVTLLAWIILLIRALINFMQKKLSIFETFLLLWFPIEVLLSNLSGRNFGHYYISWTLAVAVYSGFLFAEFWQLTFKVPAVEAWSDRLSQIVSLGLIIFFVFINLPAVTRFKETLVVVFAQNKSIEYIDLTSTYIQENTEPDDLMLTWYPEMGVNFMSGRTSPVKYVYYPLFLDDSLTNEIEAAYITDLFSKRPALILDCSRFVDAIPSLDETTRQEQFSTPGVKRKMYLPPRIEEIFLFVKDKYHIETTIDNCIIFRINQ